MRVPIVVYDLLLVVLGGILAWWLSGRPFEQFDNEVRVKWRAVENSLQDTTVPLLVVILIVVLVLLSGRKHHHRS